MITNLEGHVIKVDDIGSNVCILEGTRGQIFDEELEVNNYVDSNRCDDYFYFEFVGRWYLVGAGEDDKCMLPVFGQEITLPNGEHTKFSKEHIPEIKLSSTTNANILNHIKDHTKDSLYKLMKNNKTEYENLIRTIISENILELDASKEFQHGYIISIAMMSQYYIDSNDNLYKYNGVFYDKLEISIPQFVTSIMLNINKDFSFIYKYLCDFRGKPTTFNNVANVVIQILFVLNMGIGFQWEPSKTMIASDDTLFENGVECEPNANIVVTKHIKGNLKCEVDEKARHDLLCWFRFMFGSNESIMWILNLCNRILENKNHKLAVFLVGPSNSGKTTFLNFLRKFYNNCAVSINAASFDHLNSNGLNPALADALTSNIAIAEEGSKDLNPETFKQFVGGESEIFLRKCYENGNSQAPICTCFFACNAMPKFTTHPDEATLNRLCIFKLNNKFSRTQKFNYNTQEHFNTFLHLIRNYQGCTELWCQEILNNRQYFNLNSKYINLENKIINTTNPDDFISFDEMIRNFEFPNPSPQYVRSIITTTFGVTFDSERNGWSNIKWKESRGKPYTEWVIYSLDLKCC